MPLVKTPVRKEMCSVIALRPPFAGGRRAITGGCWAYVGGRRWVDERGDSFTGGEGRAPTNVRRAGAATATAGTAYGVAISGGASVSSGKPPDKSFQ